MDLGSQQNLSSKRNHGVTLRVVVVSLLLAAVFGYCLPIIDFRMSNTFLGAMHMPAGAIAVLMLLLLVINPLLKLLAARASFSRNEVLTIYITCLFSTLVPGKGSETFFIPNILSSFYFATKENKWLDVLLPNLNSWMTPAINPDGTYNARAVEGWYMGLGPGESLPWAMWLLPLVAWGLLIFSMYVMQGCLGVILRAQWAEREALAFPLLKLPLEMTEDMERRGESRSGFWNNPLMWIGFGIAVFIEGFNGLNLYFPDVPNVPLSLASNQFFTEAPWNQIGTVMIQFYPAIVGISFLLTAEVSFSLWFFHLFSKFQLIVAYMMGFQPSTMEAPLWTRGWAKGFIAYQTVGAIFAYVALLLWIGREQWKHIFLRAVGRTPARSAEREEALSYPVAFWGFVASLTLIIAWTIAAGVQPHVAIALWAFYLAVCLVLTRLVVEGGLLFVQTGWMPLGPLSFLTGAGPGQFIGPASAAPASMISNSLMLDMRGFLLPSFVQSFKLAQDRKIAIKPLLALIAAVSIVSFSIGVWKILDLGYNGDGALQMQNFWAQAAGNQPAQHTTAMLRGLETSIAANWGWVAVGATLTWLMMVARSRYSWFILHPIGLMICTPFAMHSMWLSIFLGWSLKVLITRFGGTDSYRKTIPLFLGLTLGSVVMIVFWVVIDAWQGRTGHALLPF